MKQHPVAVIGAGPYGLSVAAHLLHQGVPTTVFGKTMAFWERMPAGMFLKSVWSASSLADPQRRYTLDRYVQTTGYAYQEPVPLPDFVEYGRWFQRNTVPQIDPTFVQTLQRDGLGFRLELEDGRSVNAASVIVATGIQSFAYLPSFVKDLPESLASHSQDYPEFSAFRGKRVAVLGRGQSAAQTAAFLHEAGAEVELLARGPMIWIRRRLYDMPAPIRSVFYPASDVGPPGLNWLIHFPEVFRQLPPELRAKIERRATRPAGAKWLRDRVEGHVTITPDVEITQARPRGDQLSLTLSDGSTRLVDHLIAGTGYHPALDRLAFIDPMLRERVIQTDGLPILDAGFESSVPGLFFVGAISNYTFGPLCRFVAGSGVAGRHITRRLAQEDGRQVVPVTLPDRALVRG
ncbi:MAG: NAD(P)-binding domain-containing protein [Ktedonobacterales bacterium]